MVGNGIYYEPLHALSYFIMTALRGKYIEIAHFGDERIEAQRCYFQHDCKTESENVSYVSVTMDSTPNLNNIKGPVLFTVPEASFS